MYANASTASAPAVFSAHVLEERNEPGSLSDVVIYVDKHKRVRLAFTWPELRELYHFLGRVIDDNLSTPKAAVVESLELFDAELG